MYDQFFLILFEFTFLLKIYLTFFADKCKKKNEVIDRYMQNVLKNAHVCIYSLADLNISHCVEMTFFQIDIVSIKL